MTNERAAGLPSIVLYALPPLSMLSFVGLIAFSGSSVVAPLLGFLWWATLIAELVVLPACLFAVVRFPHLRSRTQAGGLALIAAHLLLMIAAPFFGGGI